MTRSERTKEFFENWDGDKYKSNKKPDNRLVIALAIHNMTTIRPYTKEDFIRKYNNESLIKINE